MIGDVLTDVGRDTAKAIAAGGAKAGFVTARRHRRGELARPRSPRRSRIGRLRHPRQQRRRRDHRRSSSTSKPPDLRRMCDVNVVGTALGMKHAFRAMKPGGAAGKGGAIVNIASVAATIAFPGIAGYSGDQVRGRPADPGRRDGSGQARLRRPRQLHLSGPRSDRHGHATGGRRRGGRALSRAPRPPSAA